MTIRLLFSKKKIVFIFLLLRSSQIRVACNNDKNTMNNGFNIEILRELQYLFT
jgi:hypothetical protein